MRHRSSNRVGSRYKVSRGFGAMVALWFVAALVGCAEDATEQTAKQEEPAPAPAVAAVPPDTVDKEPAVPAEPRPERYDGDLDVMRERGRLRILIPANIGGAFYLPRTGWPVVLQHEAAEAFARSEGLEPELVPVDRFSDIIPALLDGRGDVIAANLTITDSRRKHIAFSVPLTTVRQQVLVAADNDAISKVADLVGKRVMVDPSSSFWERLQTLDRRYPGIQLVERPESYSDEHEVDAVSQGEVDAVLRDSNVAEMYLSYRDDIKLAFQLPGVDAIAWGLRPDAPKLRAALNRFMHLEFASQHLAKPHTGDLDVIRSRRLLRVLLRNNAASYFLYRGELKGFEYELAKAFAKSKGLRLEVIVPDTHVEMIDWLKEGRADIAAGFLEADPELESEGITFSRPYHRAPRHFVVQQGSGVEGIADLAALTVMARRSSAYWKDLEALRNDGALFELVAAPEDVETEELIDWVANGLIDGTVADGHLLEIELARGVAVQSGFTISDERAHSVAVRAGNPQLLTALNEFIRSQYRGVTYNLLRRKYFTNRRKVRDLAAGRAAALTDGRLSPYDDITRRYAERYGFDWRLITAQMFQESRFDPKAKSFAGARGLLQVMPRTARFMGFEAVDEPEQGIHAGVKYLDWVRDRFEPSLPFSERMWFTLAAYNAGHGHVQDARRLAREKGWDGDRWFDNTERAMLLLAKKKYARKARHGYVRGAEPVGYVRNIRQRYRAYVELTGERIGSTLDIHQQQLAAQ